MKSLAFHQANMLATKVVSEVIPGKSVILQALEISNQNAEDEKNIPPVQQENNVSSNMIQLEILKILKNMQGKMKNLRSEQLYNPKDKTNKK